MSRETRREAFRRLADEQVAPYADQADREERLPDHVVAALAGQGALAGFLPSAMGGVDLDAVEYGVLHEEIGRACSSVRSLMTVQDMVARALFRWGSAEQKAHWLPALTAGRCVAAFALSEPLVGSDAGRVETSAVRSGDAYVLNGCKRWITAGQIADLFLVFAVAPEGVTAFLVERDTPGLSTTPITGLIGCRASMLAEVRLEDCRVPADGLVGRAGFGFSHVAAAALDLGRYSVACGCVGIAQACLDASLAYAGRRQQFGSALREHQLVQRMITDMVTGVAASRLLCEQAGALRAAGDPESLTATAIAKYFASTTARRIAADAVQLHGANGCTSDYPVQRFLRDATIMEIIEGSTQIQQMTIARQAFREWDARAEGGPA